MSVDYSELKTAYQDPDEFKESTDSLSGVHFKSGLQIFKDHDGFRGGEIHTFIGTKGSGKSTWSKTILAELAYQEKETLLYISEERQAKYNNGLNKSFKIAKWDESKIKDLLDNIVVVSEIDMDINQVEDFFRIIEEIIENLDLKIFVMDNFTTSFLSELQVNIQSAILRRFKKLADKFNIPVILFFHTSKLYDAKKLDGDNVRGSGTAINIGSYNYIIAQHKENGVLRNFVFTEKARYHTKSNKAMYEMFYDDRIGLFSSCEKIEFDAYKEIVDGKQKKLGFK